ncbi:hypothetical protein O1D80_002166 [Vibrio cholerae]|nr:hypothetical protein [Vibrio cholerae]
MTFDDTSNTESFSLEQFQDKAFHEASAKLNETLPSNICIGVGNKLSIADIDELKKKGLLSWDLPLKLKPFMSTVSNEEHKLLTVVYYGDGVIGRYCAGYALGCVNHERSAVELNFIEKRSDASEDLYGMFLPAIYEAWTTYVYALNDIFGFSVDKFVIVGPIPGVKRYYTECGFKAVDDYFGSEAMIRQL